MRVGALPALTVGAVLQATLVRSLHVPSPPLSHPWAPYPEATPFEEQEEEPDDEFEVRLTPDEVKALSGRAFRREPQTPCPVLQLGAGADRKLYFNMSSDGLGSRILNLMGALIYAEKMNLGFGGMVAEKKRGVGLLSSHYVDISVGMQSFFGFADASELFLDHVPEGTQRFQNLQDLSKKLEEGAIDQGVNVHIQKMNEMESVNYHMQVSPTISRALKISNVPIMKMPLTHFHPSDLNVAVHVRRGDVSAQLNFRGTSHKYYLWLMNIMRSKVPDAKFHVFSETGPHSKMSEFNNYSEWGAMVHLDTEARETLAHMARADVLVTAHSSFSYAAALVNPNCVLQQRWMISQPGWVLLPHNLDKLGDNQSTRQRAIGKLTRKIGSCMTSIVARRSAQL